MGQARRKEKNPEKAAEAPAPVEGPEAQAPFPRWEKPRGLTRRGWAILGTLVVLFQFPLLHYYLLRGEAPATTQVPYQQDFSDPGVVERDFYSTGGYWRVVDGQLLSPGVKNNPLWLQAKLPRDVAVEFDVRSESTAGDIKVELFGDGSDHASGYVFIHGGWNNSISVIARLDEHGASLDALNRRGTPPRADTHLRVEANPFPVKVGRTYHWRIERSGSELRWLIDGRPFMQFNDSFPLTGRGHDRFAFSSWESQLYFDNLKIEPL